MRDLIVLINRSQIEALIDGSRVVKNSMFSAQKNFPTNLFTISRPLSDCILTGLRLVSSIIMINALIISYGVLLYQANLLKQSMTARINLWPLLTLENFCISIKSISQRSSMLVML